MRTLKLKLNKDTDHSEVPYGPPLPHSIFLWKVWGGCYEGHPRCLPLLNPVTNKVRHETVDVEWALHTARCAGAQAGCEYFLHWLMGELEKPGDLKTDIEWGFAK